MKHKRMIGPGLLLVASLAGCSGPAADGEPTPPEVRRALGRLLADSSEHLLLTSDLRQEGDGNYSAEAKGEGGVAYKVTAEVRGRSLRYRAEGGGRILGGYQVLPEPSFAERHPDAMQTLRACAIVVHSACVLWPLLGAFGLRRRYSRRVETFLSLFAAINAGFVALWVYQFVTHFGAA